MKKKGLLTHIKFGFKLATSFGISFIISGIVALATRNRSMLVRTLSTIGGMVLAYKAMDIGDLTVDEMFEDLRIVVEDSKEELREV